jgi:hypothetical protein
MKKAVTKDKTKPKPKVGIGEAMNYFRGIYKTTGQEEADTIKEGDVKSLMFCKSKRNVNMNLKLPVGEEKKNLLNNLGEPPDNAVLDKNERKKLKQKLAQQN